MRGKLILVAIIFGVISGVFGVQEMRLSRTAKAEPQAITCDKLITAGFGDNAHITLSEFVVSPAYIYRTKKRSSEWQTVWVPLLPVNAETEEYIEKAIEAQKDGKPLPIPTNIRVLLESNDVASESAVDLLGNEVSLNGTVVNAISGLGTKEKEMLQQSYPSANLDNIVIIDHNRKPKGTLFSLGLIGLGVLLVGGGIGAFFIGNKS
jgi:hypothetical protein